MITRPTYRFAAAINLLMLVFLVPAVLWNNLFRTPPGQAPAGRGVLVVALLAVWAALALRRWSTPSGNVWPLPIRLAVFVGGHLLTIAVMWWLHGGRWS